MELLYIFINTLPEKEQHYIKVVYKNTYYVIQLFKAKRVIHLVHLSRSRQLSKTHNITQL